MKARHGLLASALLGSGLLAAFGDRTPSPSQAPVAAVRPVPRPDVAASITSVRSAASAPSSQPSPATLLDIADRSALIGRRPDDSSPTFFSSRSWSPPPPAAPAQAPEALVPSPPPMPFVYFGRQFKAGHWEVFVSEGDTTLILHESQTIDSRYRIDSIAPPTMTMTYLPLNVSTSLSIE